MGSELVAQTQDSTQVVLKDTIPVDSEKSAQALDKKIAYKAADSIIFELDSNIIYLYKEGNIDYDDINLQAGYIEYRMKKNEIYATSIYDSTNQNVQGSPIFKQGNEEPLKSDELRYNFKTKKGIVKHVTIQQGEGTLSGNTVKIDSSDEIYIKGAEYCPCKEQDAGTFFKIDRVKVTKNKDIIAGPLYLSIEGIPTPLAFPFAFFPNQSRSRHGILLPSPGNYSDNRGFALNGLGYYIPISDYLDTQFKTDIYSRGSWSLSNRTNYKKRYKYNGYIDIKYISTKEGDASLSEFTGEYSKTSDFKIIWSHKEDRNAHPYRNFRSDVNISTRNANQNQFSNNSGIHLNNSFNSSITYEYNFPDIPFDFRSNFRLNQNTQTKTINLKIPDVNINMDRVALPLSFLSKGGSKKWYEKIYVNYNSTLNNRISAYDSLYTWDNIPKLWDMAVNGIKHAASVSTNIKTLNGGLNFTPSFNINERWHFKTVDKNWNNTTQELEIDTIQGFVADRDYRFQIGASTALYTYFGFKEKFQPFHISKFRWVLKPSLNYSYSPNFDPNNYGYYNNLGSYQSYSRFEINQSILGGASAGVVNSISLNFQNNLEVKVMTPNDSTRESRNIPIIQSLSINGISYNFARDSLNLSKPSFSGSTPLFKQQLNINYGGQFTLYQKDSLKRDIDRLWLENGKLTKLEAFRVNTNWRIKSKRKNGKAAATIQQQGIPDPFFDASYLDFSIPWEVSMGLQFNANRQYRQNLKDTFNLSASVTMRGSMNLTDNWRVSFSTNYNAITKKVGYTSFNIGRDLNCWVMDFVWIPFGSRASYGFNLYIKSQILKDLKIKKERNQFTPANKL